MGEDKVTNAREGLRVERQIKVVKPRDFNKELVQQEYRFIVSDRKKAQRQANRAATNPHRARRRKQFCCFWTWPWGHVYDQGRCVGCGVGKPMNL